MAVLQAQRAWYTSHRQLAREENPSQTTVLRRTLQHLSVQIATHPYWATIPGPSAGGPGAQAVHLGVGSGRGPAVTAFIADAQARIVRALRVTDDVGYPPPGDWGAVGASWPSPPLAWSAWSPCATPTTRPPAAS
ncbi:hypothetical protein [Streptomyces lydicus]|uniref:hypothetical protein n=1 Tax=Streptomyces lydicus TaxID=47763 RepID=UPI00378B6F07